MVFFVMFFFRDGYTNTKRIPLYSLVVYPLKYYQTKQNEHLSSDNILYKIKRRGAIYKYIFFLYTLQTTNNNT